MKNRKIHVCTEQEIVQDTEKTALAMGGAGDWHGACNCVVAGNTHLETKVQEYYNPDLVQAGLGALGCIVGGAAMYYSAGWATYLGASSCMINGFNSLYQGLSNTSTITYHRLMRMVSVSTRKHEQHGKTWIE